MNRLIRLLTVLPVVALVMPMLACPARADSGSVFTLSQDGKVLNKVATWERSNGQARITLLGSTLFLDVNMREPLSSANDEDIFVYTAIDTRAQPANPTIWQAVARGEVALDRTTMRNNSVDGWWRKTETIQNYVNMTKLVPDASPRQQIRFVVETR
jgi:hypothetical protein